MTHIKATPGDHELVWLDDVALRPEPSLKIRNHSPTGFSWGYNGSGPAQLALAILNERYGKEIALRNYQDFKSRFVAGWNFNGEVDCEVDIDGWIAPRIYSVGMRVRLKRHVERYPHFSAPPGLEGVVVHADEEMICVRMDEILPGAEEWRNEIHWYLPNGDGEDIVDDLELLSEEERCECGSTRSVEGDGPMRCADCGRVWPT